MVSVLNTQLRVHTLLAHQLLIDNVHTVWMSAVTQRLVIQFSRYGHFCI